MNLGGVCLGYSQLPLQLRLPAGQHMLAVVVQDSQGAVRRLRRSVGGSTLKCPENTLRALGGHFESLEETLEFLGLTALRVI